MFTHIDHVAISVKDADKSIKFYEDFFGFKKYYEHDVPSVDSIEKVIYLKLNSTVLELEHWNIATKNSGYHFCLISDNFDEDYEKLLSANIPIATPLSFPEARTPNEIGWKRVVFYGPDDELIEIRG